MQEFDMEYVDFPHMVEAEDYHEFPFIQKCLQNALPKCKVKVKEIGYCGDRYPYKGIAYIDCQDSKYRKIKREIEAWERRAGLG